MNTQKSHKHVKIKFSNDILKIEIFYNFFHKWPILCFVGTRGNIRVSQSRGTSPRDSFFVADMDKITVLEYACKSCTPCETSLFSSLSFLV